MITLITGSPGAGKSAAMMALLTGEYAGRPLFVDGVPDLKLPHEPLDVKSWPASLPDGSLAVIDEVQRCWRPRGPGQKVPDDVAALETHRHRGLDFVLVTQAPSLLDKNVRALVGRHIHLRDVGVLGRWWYEWPECSENLAWRSAPVKRRYRLPKRVFSLYRSASLHVKPVRSLPPMLAVLLLAVVGVGFFGWRTYSAVQSKRAPAEASATPAAGVAPGPVRSAPARPVPWAGEGGSVSSPAAYRASFRPVDPNEPLTAPAYDHLRRVVRMPRVVGGYCVEARCLCFLQDGTRARIPEADCDDRVRRGRFDPYHAPELVADRASASTKRPSAAKGGFKLGSQASAASEPAAVDG